MYIIIAANEYKLARNSNCFDINSGKYLQFKNIADQTLARIRQQEEAYINKKYERLVLLKEPKIFLTEKFITLTLQKL